MCPVACGACAICAGHPLVAAYAGVFRRFMPQPPGWSLTPEFAVAVSRTRHQSALRAAVGYAGQSFATCTIVGSSGSLLTDRYGAEIDAADLVLRFNNALTKSFEPIVGTRTDVRVLNSHAAAAVLQRCAKFDARGRCVPRAASGCCPKAHVLLNSGRDRIVECYQRACGGAANVKQLLANHSLVRAFQDAAPRRTVMSGVFGLALARTLCTHRIRLYGFSTGRAAAPRAAVPTAYHYYDGCDSFTADGLNATLADSGGSTWLERAATTPVAGAAPIVIRPATGSWPSYEAAAAARLAPCAARSGIGGVRTAIGHTATRTNVPFAFDPLYTASDSRIGSAQLHTVARGTSSRSLGRGGGVLQRVAPGAEAHWAVRVVRRSRRM